MAKRGSISDKVSRIINGEQVIVSTPEYDNIVDIFNANDRFYNLFGKFLVSIPNPGQVGTKDQFVAYLKK